MSQNASGGATPGRARSNDLAGKIHRPGSSPGPALPSPAYFFASVIVLCFILTVKRRWRFCVLRATTKKGRQLFFEEKVDPGDLARGFYDLEMTWLLYCAGAAAQNANILVKILVIPTCH